MRSLTAPPHPLLCAGILFVVLSLFSGCAGSDTLSVDDVRADPPPSVALYLRDGRLLRLQSYAVFASEIAGTGNEISSAGTLPFAGSVAIADVQRVESVRSTDIPLIVLGAVAGAAFLAGVLMNSANDGDIIPIR